MADAKISALTAIGSLALEDLFAVVDDPSGTPASRKATLTQLLALLAGKQTVAVPAGAINPTTTNGCAALTDAETTTNAINYKYLAFDASSEEKAYFWMATPKSYDAGTVTMRFIWTHPSTTTNFDVIWEAEILSLSNDDAMDTAVGTAVTVTDTGGTTEDFYISAETSAITAANTPAAQDWLYVQVSRKAADGSDTLAVDAHLIGVELIYNTDALKDD